MDLSFHVPTSNTQFVGDENRPPAHVSLLSQHWCKWNTLKLQILTTEIPFSLDSLGDYTEVCRCWFL